MSEVHERLIVFVSSLCAGTEYGLVCPLSIEFIIFVETSCSRSVSDLSVCFYRTRPVILSTWGLSVCVHVARVSSTSDIMLIIRLKLWLISSRYAVAAESCLVQVYVCQHWGLNDHKKQSPTLSLSPSLRRFYTFSILIHAVSLKCLQMGVLLTFIQLVWRVFLWF